MSVLLVRGGGRNDPVRTRPAKAPAVTAPEVTPGAARVAGPRPGTGPAAA
ncbi:hypothetical protein ACIO93_21600 [Streptomyces sp. NPDC087903]